MKSRFFAIALLSCALVTRSGAAQMDMTSPEKETPSMTEEMPKMAMPAPEIEEEDEEISAPDTDEDEDED